MNKTVAAVLILVVVAVIAFVALRGGARTAALSEECRGIQRRLAAIGIGGDPAERARLESALRECARDLAASGVDVDMSDIALGNATNTASQIAAEWSNYRATDYSDLSRRQNTRNAILRLLDTLRDNLAEAAANASTEPGRARVRAAIEAQIVASLRRARCFTAGEGGCGRLGVNEPDWDERARDELQHGAFALGLREAIDSGWRSPSYRDPAASAPYQRSLPSGNFAPPGLFSVGEVGPLVDPSWDDFGGGPHYAGQTVAVREAYLAANDAPYRLVKPAPDLGAGISRYLSRPLTGAAGGISLTSFTLH